MKIAVIGIGGVGGIVTSALKAVEDELILVCRGETAKAIKENGLIVRSDMLGDRVVKPFLVSNDPKEIGIVDAAIICCKTYSLKNVIEMYKDIIGKETLVVPLQNGVTAAGEAEKQLDGRGYVADRHPKRRFVSAVAACAGRGRKRRRYQHRQCHQPRDHGGRAGRGDFGGALRRFF